MKEILFNSEKINGKQSYQLASGYDSQTKIFFEKEGITADIQAVGHIDYYDAENTLLASIKVPESNGGREVYEDIVCEANNGCIVLRFPIYQWIDNYPHCDGEHDRWDTRVIGYHAVRFDLTDHTVACE